MSWIKDFNELNIKIQGFAASVILLMPIFYIAIYLFHYSFFIRAGLYICICFCLVFSTLWFLIALLINYLLINIHNRIDKLKPKNEIESDSKELVKKDSKESTVSINEGDVPFIASGLDSILYLSFGMIVLYYLKNKMLLNITFNWFIISLFICIILRFSLLFFLWWFIRKVEKNRSKNP